MSDINIPGVTASKYKTDELIKGLMKVERIPRDRADEELKTYRKQQSAWREINQRSTTLRDSARGLFSYNNPFTEKATESTDERAITASVTREARDQNFRVVVSQTAEADSFLSSELPADGKVPAGTYAFSAGESGVTFNWKGGSYRDFTEALNRRGEGIIRASLVQITPKTRSILIESQKTGKDQRLSFSQDALAFALDAGLIKKNDKSALTPSTGTITAGPLSNGLSEFSAPARAKDGLILEYQVSVAERAPADPSGPEAGMGPSKIESGSITYGGITVQNIPSEMALTDLPPPAPAAPVEDSAILSLRSTKGSSLPLPSVEGIQERLSFSVPLSEYGDVDALIVQNRNTAREVRVEGIRVIDPRVAGEYVPVNPVSVAQDAMLKYEGITITRPTNSIDDLIPGVTLELHEATGKQETVTIKPDTEAAKEAIISLVGNYNRVMAEINILTQNKPELINEISYFTEDEKKTAEERLGMMQGDTTLNGIKSSLQRITTNVYNSSDTTSTTTLTQLGISTKSTAGAGIEYSRLRGYLEIDEKKLDEALSSKILDIKALFGYDSDGDLVIDSGIAHALDANLAPYVQTGGIFATRTSGLDGRIGTTEKKIARLDEQLEAKEAELKAKYGQMEGTLNSLQQQSNSISNFNNQNNNR